MNWRPHSLPAQWALTILILLGLSQLATGWLVVEHNPAADDSRLAAHIRQEIDWAQGILTNLSAADRNQLFPTPPTATRVLRLRRQLQPPTFDTPTLMAVRAQLSRELAQPIEVFFGPPPALALQEPRPGDAPYHAPMPARHPQPMPAQPDAHPQQPPLQPNSPPHDPPAGFGPPPDSPLPVQPAPMPPRSSRPSPHWADAWMATAKAADQPAALAQPAAGAGAYLWVSFRHGREGAPRAYWLILPLPPEVRSSPHHIWISMVGITLATLLSAGLLLWQFNRPLRDLALAARRYAQGIFIEPVPERGPRDVREVASQFNRMAEELQRASRDREEMLAGVSHDVRAPLTRMRIRAEMVEDEENRLGLVRDVAEIERITDQFLAFARGDRDSEGATLVDLAELLSSLAQAYQGTGRDVRVTAVGIAHWPLREMAIKRALTNLIENAIHYGAEPIELSADHDGRQLLLNVRDHGAGLSAEACERARRPFVRLDPSRGGQGHSGLGLSIVERIVALHQGSFRFGNAQQGGGVLAQLLLPERSTAPNHPQRPPQQ